MEIAPHVIERLLNRPYSIEQNTWGKCRDARALALGDAAAELLRPAIQKRSVARGLVTLGLDPSKLTRSCRRYCMAVDEPSRFCRWRRTPFWGPRPTYADPRHAFSIRQHYLTPLDLIVAKTSRYLAIRTSDRRIAGDRNPELWIVTLIDGLLKCNKPCARWITAPNGEVPLCR